MMKFLRQAVLPLVTAVPAFAVDADALVRILSQAYLAEDLAAVCAAQDPAFAQGGLGGFHSVGSYALHIRQEVVGDLAVDEAQRIVQRAAAAARSAALLAIRAHSAEAPPEERANLLDWCKRSAAPFIEQLVSMHDRDHAALDRALDLAKRQ